MAELVPDPSKEKAAAFYTIFWVCALPIEMGAALHMLDELHSRNKAFSGDSNIYTLGKIGPHYVVIVCLPKGTTGNDNAAVVVKDMQRSFTRLKYGFMVGIAGACPTLKYDIRLGDIIVSTPSGETGGIVQYDFGKAEKEGFKHSGSIPPPPPFLRSIVASIEAGHLVYGTKFAQIIDRVIEQDAKGPKVYVRPGKDILFKAEFVHPGGDDCSECDQVHQVVIRTARTNPNEPRVHYGIIGTGNQVMKDAKQRDRIAAEYSLLCFEMEAAGVQKAFPSLVIRGISDYADSHKNDEWKPYAALTASVYCAEFLRVLPQQL
jgi:nucleoside phosphorylase